LLTNLKSFVKASTFLITALSALAITSCSEDRDATLAFEGRNARELAVEAYHQMEANVFNPDEVNAAIRKLKAAQKSDPNEPFVYLTTSLAILVRGYKIGEWYDMETFLDGTIDKAITAANTALALDPKLAHSYAHLARLQIVKKDFQKAQELLNTVQTLDPQSFYGWYFQGILYEKLATPEKARDFFDKAEFHVRYEYQRMLVNLHRQNVAALEKDFSEQERLLKKNIANEPESPHLYGNFAHFLMEHGRYVEAVENWQKAIHLDPYPEALRRLREAEQLRDEQLKAQRKSQ
jgi:tetratricopeptide (TPR) repeat protein